MSCSGSYLGGGEKLDSKAFPVFCLFLMQNGMAKKLICQNNCTAYDLIYKQMHKTVVQLLNS